MIIIFFIFMINTCFISFYFYRSMKTNLIAFFADLFNVLEIHPAKCVSFNQGRNDLADGNLNFLVLFVQIIISWT